MFDTQRRAVALEADENDPVPLVSVFLAPNEVLGDDVVVAESDRNQVLDAIITYPGALVVVVETKVAEADAAQAANLNIEGVAVTIAHGQKPVLVRWPDLLADLNGILERNLVGGAERDLLADFLSYVEDNFPDLGRTACSRSATVNPFVWHAGFGRFSLRRRARKHESTDGERAAICAPPRASGSGPICNPART